MNSVIAFDDSGPAGADTESKFMNPLQKMYVGVVVPHDIVSALSKDLENYLHVLEQQYGAQEFHIKEIVNDQGPWQGVEREEKLSVLQNICEIISKYNLTCINQTWSNLHYDQNKINRKELDREIPGTKFNLSKYEHFAFIKALHEVKGFVSEQGIRLPVDLYCDEGMYPDGTDVPIHFLNGIVSGQCVKFMSSHKSIFIQLADIAAYFLNKVQMIANKPKRTDWDKEIILAISSANIQYTNSEQYVGPLARLDTELYDYTQTLNHKDKHPR